MGSSGTWITALTSLVIGSLAGYVMHRSDFCMAGMVRDIFLFRRYFMLRILALLVMANMFMIEVARLSGLLTLFPYPGFGAPSLTNVIGGMLFGVGMVLAGGCVAGTLYKLGSGNIVSGFAFLGLITGSTLYAEFHVFWKAVAGAGVLLPGKITLAQLIGVSQTTAVSGVFLLLGMAALYWLKTGVLVRRSHAAGYLQPWKAALILALLVALSVVIIGIPLGITTAYAKMGSWLQSLVAPQHVQNLGYFSVQSFNFTNPRLAVNYSGGPGPLYDGFALIQYPLVTGIIAGGFISSSLLREFRIYSNVPRLQLISGFIGGVLMGLSSRMAPSCNIWHLLGGLPILSLQSILFVTGLLPGAWLGGKLLSGIILKNN